jgi:hypothetical protein
MEQWFLYRDIKPNHEDWLPSHQQHSKTYKHFYASANTGINNTKQLKEINNLIEN